jgi:hypothetical protein
MYRSTVTPTLAHGHSLDEHYHSSYFQIVGLIYTHVNDLDA